MCHPLYRVKGWCDSIYNPPERRGTPWRRSNVSLVHLVRKIDDNKTDPLNAHLFFFSSSLLNLKYLFTYA